MSITEYLIGDRVRVQSDHWSGNFFNGQVGTVATVNDGPDFPYMVEFDDGESWHFTANELVLIGDDHPFKDGRWYPQSHVDELKAQIDSLEVHLANAREDREELGRENTALEEQVSALFRDKGALEHEVGQLKTAIAAAFVGAARDL